MRTALALKNTHSEESDMAPAENPDVGNQLGKLSSDVQHVQSDINNIKIDVREIRTRFEGKIDALDKKLEAKFDAMDAKIEKKIGDLREKLDNLKDSLASAKIWALSLYIGMYVTLAGGLLYVIARGNKWI
jgi:chromosome segregation ATPase